MFASTLVVGRHLCRFVSFRFVSFRFVSFCFVSFRFVSFRFVSFRFVSFRFVSTAPLKVGWCLVVVPGVLSPKGSSSSVPRVSSPNRRSSLFLRVLSPKGIWGGVDDDALSSRLFLRVSSPNGSWDGRYCRARQRIYPWGFVPKGNLGRRQ